MNKLLTLLLVLCVGGVALAEEVDYGWEDGGTILNAYPNPGSVIATNVNNWTEGENVETGNFAVKLELNEMGEAQGYLVYVWNLVDGDEVTVSFSRYTEEGGATVLIGGHWNDELPMDPDAITGDAGGNDDAGMTGAWEETSYTWTVAGNTGLVIEARLAGEAGQMVWLDNLTVTAPDMASIQIPGCSPVGTEMSTLSDVKTLFR